MFLGINKDISNCFGKENDKEKQNCLIEKITEDWPRMIKNVNESVAQLHQEMNEGVKKIGKLFKDCNNFVEKETMKNKNDFLRTLEVCVSNSN